jgi:NAD(P)-dependent dehydrogenase (short-subunit alcohol dehydrogenase family)
MISSKDNADGRNNMLECFDLTGSRAIVTGASRGIGFAVARGLAQAGASIIMVARGEESLKAASDRIMKETGNRNIDVRVCDITVVEEIRKLFDEIWDSYGRLDILVNNVGVSIPVSILDATEEHWNRMMDMNAKSLYFCSQAFGRKIFASEHQGSIINIASQLSFVGYPNRSIYCGAKGNVLQLTKAMAVEWAPKIRVNGIAPTYIETEMNTSMLSEPAFRNEVISRIPMGRIGEPEDIGGAAVYLASQAAKLVTGHTIVVDGGWTAI